MKICTFRSFEPSSFAPFANSFCSMPKKLIFPIMWKMQRTQHKESVGLQWLQTAPSGILKGIFSPGIFLSRKKKRFEAMGQISNVQTSKCGFHKKHPKILNRSINEFGPWDVDQHSCLKFPDVYYIYIDICLFISVHQK